jgi:pilus assembly protein Flp/PilA
MKKVIEWIAYEESGQGIVEYSLIFALVVIVIIVTLTAVGQQTLALYNETLSKMP